MSELKPCPFCGSEVQGDERGEKYPKKSPMGGWIIHCECCGASLSQFRKSGKDEISWNTRPIEDALNKRIAELEAENDQLTAHDATERQDDKCSKPEPNVCEACGGDGAVLLTDGYKGQVIATAKCIYCNGTGRVNKEREE